MAQQRALAMMNLAAQQQQQQAQFAQQQAMLPQQAYYQGLGRMQEAFLGSQQSAQDFSEAQQIAQQQNAAALEREQLQAETQLQRVQQQNEYQQNAQWVQRFTQPFTDYQKITQQRLQQGYNFTPEQQSDLQEVQKNIGALVDDVNSGRTTRGVAMSAFQPLYNKMMAIQPTEKQQTTEDWFQANSVVDPNTGSTVLRTPEGKVITIAKKDANGPNFDENGDPTNALTSVKVERERMKLAQDAIKSNLGRSDFINKRIDQVDKMGWMRSDPNWMAQAKMEFGQEFDEAAAAGAQGHAAGMMPGQPREQRQIPEVQPARPPQPMEPPGVPSSGTTNAASQQTQQPPADIIQTAQQLMQQGVPYRQWPPQLLMAWIKMLQQQGQTGNAA